MSGIKPDLFDYNAAVDKADAEGFDWNGLGLALQDPGFESLSPEHQKHMIALYTTKFERTQGNRVDPNAETGELGGLKQLGTLLKAVLMPMVGRPGTTAKEAAVAEAVQQRDITIKAYETAHDKQQAEELAQRDLQTAGQRVMESFAHYMTGGLVEKPAESADPFVRQAMQTVDNMTSIGAVAGQLATGSVLLGFISKAPLISSGAANLSSATRGLIKGAVLDFGLRAAWPEGLPKEEQFGVADDFARAIAPDNLEATGAAARVIHGIGGVLEGGLLGYAIRGIGYGTKLADAKYGLTLSKKHMELIEESLKQSGIDVASMTKRDKWMTYRTRMEEHVQGMDEAVFNGERMSAESWIAQAFLADKNISELTPADGRFLWSVFSTNKGGISVIKGVENPQDAVDKLAKIGIKVDATAIPRKKPPEPPLEGPKKRRPRKPKPPKAGPSAAEQMGKTPEEMEQILHPSKGLPEGVSDPKQRASAETIADEEVDRFFNPNEEAMNHADALFKEAARDAEDALWNNMNWMDRANELLRQGWAENMEHVLNHDASWIRKFDPAGSKILRETFQRRPQ